MRLVRFLSLALALTLVVAACGDDDDDDGGAGTAAGGGDTTESAAGEGGDEFCTAYIEAQAAVTSAGEGDGEEPEGEEGGATTTTAPGGPTTTAANRAQTTTTTAAPAGGGEVPPDIEEAIAAAEDAAPDEVRADVEEVAAQLREAVTAEDPFSVLDTPEFAEPDERVDQYLAEECAGATSDVAASDYAFQGFEPELSAGHVAFNLSNEGEELHELALIRINDEVDASIDELLELPEEEAGTMITEVPGGAFAFPGESDTEVIELEPGRYGMVCFIPVGTTPDVIESGQEPEGAPHFTEGMFGEFTVS